MALSCFCQLPKKSSVCSGLDLFNKISMALEHFSKVFSCSNILQLLEFSSDKMDHLMYVYNMSQIVFHFRLPFASPDQQSLFLFCSIYHSSARASISKKNFWVVFQAFTKEMNYSNIKNYNNVMTLSILKYIISNTISILLSFQLS